MDITMCNGGECPLKQNCHRFTATANEFRQSYFVGTPFKLVYKDVDGFRTENIECEHFWDNKND